MDVAKSCTSAPPRGKIVLDPPRGELTFAAVVVYLEINLLSPAAIGDKLPEHFPNV